MGKRGLFVLSFPLPLEAASLGRLILNPEHPHQDFLDPASLPSKPSPDIIHSDFVNFSGVAKSSRSADLEAKLTKFASIFFEKGDKSVERLLACKATEYIVLNSTTWYKKLCAEDSVRLWLETAFVQGDKVYLITGYRTLVEANLQQQKGGNMRAGGNVTIPVGEGLGVPSGALDLGVSGSYQDAESADRGFTAPGEKIFDVQYRQVKIKWYSRKEVQASFLEPDNRWVEMFSMRSGSGDLAGDTDTIYEATLAEEDEDVPEDWVMF
jgi:hypothetical protein